MSLSPGDNKTANHALPTYPPADHILRDIPFVLERRNDLHRSRQPLSGLNLYVPDHYVPVDAAQQTTDQLIASDDIHIGVWCTVIDLLAGTLCGITIAPDWMATSSLTFHRHGHSRGDSPGGAAESSVASQPVRADEWDLCNDARVIRSGRSSVNLWIDAYLQSRSDHGNVISVGSGMVTFSRLSRPVEDIDLSKMRTATDTVIEFPRLLRNVAPASIVAALDMDVLDPDGGVVEIEMSDYVRNSFGAVNGGVVATCLTTAAQVSEGGFDRPVSDVEIHYVAQARVGPFRTRVQTPPNQNGSQFGTLVHVDLLDLGQVKDGVPAVVAHAMVRVW